MSFKQKITQEEKENILKWAKEGYGYTEISALLDNKISKQRVKQICKNAKIDAFAIKQQNIQLEHEKRMVKKWGVNWNNKEHRRSYVYTIMREKFRNKKANAKSINKPWDIEFGDLDFPTHCPILGIELDYFAERTQENSPSFDCVDPTKGYVVGNVFVISWRANRIKNDGTAQEHRAIAAFIERVALTSEPLQSAHY